MKNGTWLRFYDLDVKGEPLQPRTFPDIVNGDKEDIALDSIHFTEMHYSYERGTFSVFFRFGGYDSTDRFREVKNIETRLKGVFGIEINREQNPTVWATLQLDNFFRPEVTQTFTQDLISYLYEDIIEKLIFSRTALRIATEICDASGKVLAPAKGKNTSPVVDDPEALNKVG